MDRPRLRASEDHPKTVARRASSAPRRTLVLIGTRGTQTGPQRRRIVQRLERLYAAGAPRPVSRTRTVSTRNEWCPDLGLGHAEKPVLASPSWVQSSCGDP